MGLHYCASKSWVSLLEEGGQECFGFGGLPVKPEQDEGMGHNQKKEREERQDRRGRKDEADEDGGDDKGPEGHDDERKDMGLHADGDGGPVLGVGKVAGGDGLPGVVPGEDPTNGEAIGVEVANIGLGGVSREEWPVAPGIEVGFQALPDFAEGQVRRQGIFFKKKIFHGNRMMGVYGRAVTLKRGI